MAAGFQSKWYSISRNEVDSIYDINLHQPEAFVTQDYSISKELDESEYSYKGIRKNKWV